MVKPLHYALTIEPDLGAFTFRGNIIIDLVADHDVSSVTLDAHEELQILQCNAIEGELQRKLTFKKRKNTVIVTFPLTAGKPVKLYLAFEGKLEDNLAGFYRSSYQYKGKVGYVATTQFEAAEAKRAFPCFDNPSLKATFVVTMIVDKRHTAISNTLPVSEKKLPGEKKLVTFAMTPVMSTYLLYLGAGDWEVVQKKYGKLTIRGITTPGKSKHAAYAMEWAAKSLRFYESYFGQPYPLEKLDLIAVPDFAAGAMENWGAITFRENALLYYENSSSIATKQRIAEVVAHELVHQWFGNLVTMKWWEDLWLNESFATYMAYKAINKFYPDWEIWTEYVSYAYFGGMALDSLKSSHPVKVKVEKVEDIDELFDEIAYEKGGSVLRMLDEFLTEATFRKGLQKYISTFAYANAEAHDLWESLESVSEVPVVNLIQKYLKQTGYPVVQVDKSGNKLVLKQKRFLFLDGEHSGLWDIPLVIQTDGRKEIRHLLSKKNEVIKTDVKEYTYINHDYAGFFISSYSSLLLDSLGVQRKKLSSIDKIGLIHDLFALVLGLQSDMLSAVNYVASYFKEEKDPETLSYIQAKLMGLYFLTPRPQLKELLLYLAKSALSITGYNPQKKENPKVTTLRNGALSTLSFFDDKEVQVFLKKKFDEHIKDKKPIEPDIRGVVYGGVVWQDNRYYEKILKMYRESSIIEEQVKFLMALGNTKNKRFIKKTLDFALSKEVRFANILYVVVSVSRNPYGKQIVLDWILDHFQEMREKTGGHANTILRRMLKTVIPTCAVGREKEAVMFLRKNKLPGMEKTYEQIEEELTVYSRFTKRYAS